MVTHASAGAFEEMRACGRPVVERAPFVDERGRCRSLSVTSALYGPRPATYGKGPSADHNPYGDLWPRALRAERA